MFGLSIIQENDRRMRSDLNIGVCQQTLEGTDQFGCGSNFQLGKRGERLFPHCFVLIAQSQKNILEGFLRIQIYKRAHRRRTDRGIVII